MVINRPDTLQRSVVIRQAYRSLGGQVSGTAYPERYQALAKLSSPLLASSFSTKPETILYTIIDQLDLESNETSSDMSIYLTLLKANRNFRNLWLATVISYMGDWFNLLASAALIAQLTNSGTAVSYLFLARFLPLFVLSPFTGVLADRFRFLRKAWRQKRA